MKKAITIIISLFFFGQVKGQFLFVDSIVSRDSVVIYRVQLPENHKISKAKFMYNGIKGPGYLTKDTTSPDTMNLKIHFPKGTYTTSVAFQKWTRDPCGEPWYLSNTITVQVGDVKCTVPTFLSLNAITKSITSTWGICPNCAKYKVTFKRLNYTNPAVRPPFNSLILGTGVRHQGITPTIQEANSGQLVRTYSTDYGGYWYQVDITCTNTLKTLSNLIFVPN